MTIYQTLFIPDLNTVNSTIQQTESFGRNLERKKNAIDSSFNFRYTALFLVSHSGDGEGFL